jgi:hypothetical protein
MQRCSVLGFWIAVAGLVLRLAARGLAHTLIRSGYEQTFDSWESAFAGCGLLIAAFGMAILLLTLHHYLSGPVEDEPRRGFEPVHVGESQREE